MPTENRIDSLKSRHHQLESAIEMENARAYPDDVEIHSLKKEKLRIKDELESLTRH
ncbi:YdcH family protein [Pseudomonadota bacterium]